MKLYMAPMEGITGYIYRNTYKKHFNGIDKYFTPFIAPAKGRPLRTRERKDILPENNREIAVVPQILTNDSEDFIKTAAYLKEYGYTEININLGCPSGTVVSKYKGAGLLYDTGRLDKFLYGIFESVIADTLEISVKTRIGKLFPEEFSDIIAVYQKYPLSELIIHPRVQTDFYKNTPNRNVFQEGVSEYTKNGHSLNSICYNGDITDLSSYQEFTASCDRISKIMIGRGILRNPFLPEQIQENPDFSFSESKFARLQNFHEELLENYRSSDLGDTNTLFKMKELWFYQGQLFNDIPGAGKLLKKLKKSKTMEEYQAAVAALFCWS